ncbi:hypothetical protein MLD38_033599 [Melastoma candidum]|uniref:Uncharacterized protein n=1 Tax=Melastoma candidum TaxID=119954 RepID=A0ACB9M702_9MYRT|nr:hypothetical protein MLD38_033599 [Melastoma candidum]
MMVPTIVSPRKARFHVNLSTVFRGFRSQTPVQPVFHGRNLIQWLSESLEPQTTLSMHAALALSASSSIMSDTSEGLEICVHIAVIVMTEGFPPTNYLEDDDSEAVHIHFLRDCTVQPFRSKVSSSPSHHRRDAALGPVD